MGEEKRLKGKAIPKHETEANWLLSNYIPGQGEIVVYDIDENHNIARTKTGDGIHKVSELPFTSRESVPDMHILDQERVEAYKKLGTFYFSEENQKKFLGDPNDSTNYPGYQRVYTERSRDRGPYGMYALTSEAKPVYNAWYSKSEWATRFAKEHPGETFREPYDDEYPVLDSSVMRLNTGDILVPNEPGREGSAVSKAYVNKYVTQSKEEPSVLSGYTPARKAVAINKVANPGSYSSIGSSFVADGAGGDYYIFDADLYIDTLSWGAAGIQISFTTPMSTWLMLNKSENSAIHYTDGDTTNRKTFKLNDFPFVNNYIHVRVVNYVGSGPYVACYLNGKEVVRRDGIASKPTKVTFACTKDYRGRVEISNAYAVITNSLDTQFQHLEPTYFGRTTEEEELVKNDTWTKIKKRHNHYFVNSQYLEDYFQEKVDEIILDPDENFDQVYTEPAKNNTNNFTYYVTEDASPITVGGVSYKKDGGFYKERFPEQTTVWKNVKDNLSSYLTDPTPSSGARSKVESNTSYNNEVLTITKNVEKTTAKMTYAPNYNIEIDGVTYFGCTVTSSRPLTEPLSISTILYVYVETLISGSYTIPTRLGPGTYPAGVTSYKVPLCTIDEFWDAAMPSLSGDEWSTGYEVSDYFGPDTVEIDPAAGSGDKFLFLPTNGNIAGKKFVFETEISWGGVTSNSGGGDWCGRIRFVNAAKASMWKNDNDCDIGFSGGSFSIAPQANYVAANKIATTSTWASLRLEMIDQTLVVFVNDKEIYRKSATNNLSTNDTALGGVTLEFREVVRGTTFYFNNTFVGALDEDFFGRAIPSIPKRLEDGNINVPETPADDTHAASKKYVDKRINESVKTLYLHHINPNTEYTWGTFSFFAPYDIPVTKESDFVLYKDFIEKGAIINDLYTDFSRGNDVYKIGAIKVYEDGVLYGIMHKDDGGNGETGGTIALGDIIDTVIQVV